MIIWNISAQPSRAGADYSESKRQAPSAVQPLQPIQRPPARVAVFYARSSPRPPAADALPSDHGRRRRHPPRLPSDGPPAARSSPRAAATGRRHGRRRPMLCRATGRRRRCSAEFATGRRPIVATGRQLSAAATSEQPAATSERRAAR